MNKFFQTAAMLLFTTCLFAQTTAPDFIPGATVIFQDNFSQDPVGDFPAKWSTSGDGQVVTLGNTDGKWLKITQPTAVSPELKKSLPENCTIEFDLYLKSVNGIAPPVMFGLTSLSDVAATDVYSHHISIKIQRYNEAGAYVYAKNNDDLGERQFEFGGYVNRVLHVSMVINGTRWRVYFDDKKVVDLPKLLTPDYRHNFFIASSVIIPSSAESVYFSNVRIAAGDVDARSLLIKQLMEQGSVTTPDIQVSNQTNQLTAESQPVLDQLGQTMQQNPNMNIQVNTVQEIPATAAIPDGTVIVPTDAGVINTGAGSIINKDALKITADKIKDYLVNKFKVQVDRIITDVKVKASDAAAKNKTLGAARKLLTEIIKL